MYYFWFKIGGRKHHINKFIILCKQEKQFYFIKKKNVVLGIILFEGVIIKLFVPTYVDTIYQT